MSTRRSEIRPAIGAAIAREAEVELGPLYGRLAAPTLASAPWRSCSRHRNCSGEAGPPISWAIRRNSSLASSSCAWALEDRRWRVQRRPRRARVDQEQVRPFSTICPSRKPMWEIAGEPCPTSTCWTAWKRPVKLVDSTSFRPAEGDRDLGRRRCRRGLLVGAAIAARERSAPSTVKASTGRRTGAVAVRTRARRTRHSFPPADRSSDGEAPPLVSRAAAA